MSSSLRYRYSSSLFCLLCRRFSLKTVRDVRTVSVWVFRKVFQSLAAANRKAFRPKMVRTVRMGEFDEFTGPRIWGQSRRGAKGTRGGEALSPVMFCKWVEASGTAVWCGRMCSPPGYTGHSGELWMERLWRNAWQHGEGCQVCWEWIERPSYRCHHHQIWERFFNKCMFGWTGERGLVSVRDAQMCFCL